MDSFSHQQERHVVRFSKAIQLHATGQRMRVRIHPVGCLTTKLPTTVLLHCDTRGNVAVGSRDYDHDVLGHLPSKGAYAIGIWRVQCSDTALPGPTGRSHFKILGKVTFTKAVLCVGAPPFRVQSTLTLVSGITVLISDETAKLHGVSAAMNIFILPGTTTPHTR